MSEDISYQKQLQNDMQDIVRISEEWYCPFLKILEKTDPKRTKNKKNHCPQIP
jgi:hypothetical protein